LRTGYKSKRVAGGFSYFFNSTSNAERKFATLPSLIFWKNTL
jgi:hypothetical protein